jgi:flagellar assembly protein FliH
MPLIKASSAPASIAAFSMTDIENQARAILLRAQREAEQLLAEAQQQAQHLRERAVAAGQAQGLAQGLQKGREEGMRQGREEAFNQQKSALATTAATLMQAAGEVDRHRRELADSAVGQVIELAIAIAERITRRMGALDPGVAFDNILEALQLVVHAVDVRIAVHPSQKQAIEQLLPELRLQWPRLEHIAIAGDLEVAPGGARIFTGSGQIDARLDEQLNRIVVDLLPEGTGRRQAEELG